VVMEGSLGAHGGVWKASRDPALPGPPVGPCCGRETPSGRDGRRDGRGPSAPCGGLRYESVVGQISLAARGFRANAHWRMVAAARRHELIC